jgi:geranylgeranyl diphosphate synthase type I
MTEPTGSADAGGGDLKARIDSVLREFADREAALLEDVNPQLAPIGARLRAAVADGKRLRGMFCYWGWRAAGQGESDAAVHAAASMELVHAAALVHDDLIDDSAVRRGAPTTHVALRQATAAAGQNADTSARALAMLVGDLLMVWAGQLFADCGLPGGYIARARPLWSTLARELVAGECLEVLRTRAPGGAGVVRTADVEDAVEIARYKTAKYTIEHPLQIGGRLGGAGEALLRTFTAYGVPLGEAFQLRDDVLAVFGDSALTGKSNLDDAAGAKPTALMACAFDMAPATEREQLRALLGRGDLDAGDLEDLRKILTATGARDRVETMIEERARAARRALAWTPVPREAADALHALIGAVVDRTG